MSAFSFTPEQSQAILDRGGPLLVSAGAGSGKTRVLVERLLSRVCREGANIDEFLVITYTKAAAAELRGRILDAISKRLSEDPGNRHLRRQTTLVYRAQISTVHAFCAGVIRQNAHLLGIAPDFRAADEGDSALLQAQVLDEVLEDFYAGIVQDPDFAALVDATSQGRDDKKLCRIALELYQALQSHADPEAFLCRTLAAYKTPVPDPGQTPWGCFLLDRALEKCAYLTGEMGACLTELAQDEKLERAYGESFEISLSGLTKLSHGLEAGFLAAAGQSVEFPRLKPARACQNTELQARAKALWDRCKKDVAEIQDLVADPQGLMGDLQAVEGQISALFRLVRAFGDAYAKEKRRRGLLDFSDQEHMALKLLVEDGGPSPLAQSLSSRFREVCVDEYQDSSRVQEAIFQALSQGGEKLFLVGDVKQSIYRFRLADPGLFLEKFRAWPTPEAAPPGSPRRVILSKNFRSAPGILDAVNFTFCNIMSTKAGELDYTEPVFLQPGLPAPESAEPAVEFHLLNCQSEDADALDRPLAEALFIARRARQLHEAEKIPYGDMVLLLRAPGGRLPALSQAFAQLGVPLAAQDPGSYWNQMEVQVALSFLAVIDNPHQDIPLISVLRSPLFSFTPDDLARIRLADKNGDFYSALCRAAADGDAPGAAFLFLLEELRDAAADLPADGLLRLLYAKTTMPAVFAAMPEGRVRRRNLLLLLDCAHSFEAAGCRGLFGFLRHLGDLRERGAAPQTPSGTEASEAVRILSIHKSKGLEFPVVFLADTAHRFNTDDLRRPLLIHPDLGVGPKRVDLELGTECPTLPRLAIAEKLRDEQLAEEMRLLYVAMTRARDRLIMTAAPQNAPKTVSRLCAGFSLPPSPFRVREAGSMADWLIPLAAVRPEGQALRDLAPDLEAAAVNGTPWRITVSSSASTAEEETVAAEAPAAGPEALPPDLSPQLGFVYPHGAAAGLPSKLTATTLKGRFADYEAAAEGPPPARRREFRRPSFLADRPLSPTERGNALHLAMQFLDFSACADPVGIPAELDRLEAMGFLTAAQRAALRPEKLAAFFRSPLGHQLLAAERVIREFKFSLLVDAADYFPDAAGEQVLLQGVVDCAFEFRNKLTIIDFKTDYVTKVTQAARAAHYRGQVETYAKALSRITGLPTARRILYFFATGEAVEV